MDKNIPIPDFAEDPAPVYSKDPHVSNNKEDMLYLDLDGFDGPIDLLLTLAQSQKVDLTKISILQLVEQYTDFIETAKKLELVIAADFLVMAAWLAYLKSKLLLPLPPEEDGPSGDEMAEALKFQLARLRAMQERAEILADTPKLGTGFFARGNGGTLPHHHTISYDVSLYELLAAYGSLQKQKTSSIYKVEAFELMSTDDALERFGKMLGRFKSWTTLRKFIPRTASNPLTARSALASTFGASLELAKNADLEIRQDKPFSEIYIRPRSDLEKRQILHTNEEYNNEHDEESEDIAS